MGVFLILSVSTYGRPSQMLSALRMSPVPTSHGVTNCWSLLLCPSEGGEASKTGSRDDSLLLDSPYTKALKPLFPSLRNGSPLDPLWSFNYAAYSKVFRKVTEEDLQLQVTKSRNEAFRKAGAAWSATSERGVSQPIIGRSSIQRLKQFAGQPKKT